MADERDDRVTASYRALGREEPARELDDAILGASRRAMRRRPWLYPAVGVAAVMVLAVAISVHLERERPDATAVVPAAPAPVLKDPEAKREEPAEKAPPARRFVPDPKPASPPAEAPARAPEVATASPDLARRDAAGAAADRMEPQAEARARRSQAAERPLAALQLDEAPMPWLERIARLRQEGKHEEADRALAQFRKRYPDFKVPEEMLKRVERN